MAAPTPVSALVHSSTLVTSGVYLFIRFYFYIGVNIWVILIIIGVTTIFFSGVVGLVENDFKKIVALSTLRQIGLIIRRLGLGGYYYCFYHLILHALFKSLLFLGVGVVIHRYRGLQDGRLYGRLMFSSPVLGVYFLLSLMRLIGIPYISGFYSKDLIVEYSLFMGLNLVILVAIYLSLGLTLIYRARLIYNFVFQQSLNECSLSTKLSWVVPIGILGVLSVLIRPWVSLVILL